MKKQPKISVCIPCKNAELWFAQAVESIKDQTFKDWEIVVVDDGSTDSIFHVYDYYGEELKDKFVLIESKESRGIAVARNLAVYNSRGEIICVQDADDVSQKERLDKTWKYFKRHKDIDLVYGSCQYIDFISKPYGTVAAEPFDFDRIKKENWIQHPTVAYRKTAFDTVGGYRPECKVIDDWHLYYDFYKAGKRIGHMDDTLAFYRAGVGVSTSEEKREEVERMKKQYLTEVNAESGVMVA